MTMMIKTSTTTKILKLSKCHLKLIYNFMLPTVNTSHIHMKIAQHRAQETPNTKNLFNNKKGEKNIKLMC